MTTFRNHPSEVVRRAAVLAHQHHAGRIRWYSNDSYYFHCERVAGTVNRSHDEILGNTRDLMLVAALLHDSVEDTDYTTHQASLDFPELPDLPRLLDLLTHKEGDNYVLDYLWLLKQDPMARVIKRADMCDNMSTLPFDSKLWKKYSEGIQVLSS